MGILDAPAIITSRPPSYATKATSALLPFRAALADRENNPVNILVLGDSTDEGTGISTNAADRNKTHAQQLQKLLRQRFPTSGETVTNAPTYVPVRTVSGLPTGWVLSGFTQGSNYGLAANHAQSAASGNTATYVCPVGTTDFDIHHVAGASLTGLTVAVDGGAASATFGNTGSTRDGATYRVSGLDPSVTHTVVVTAGGNNSIVTGIALYQGNASKGIRVWNAGHHGSRTFNYINGGTWNWLPATPAVGTFAGVQSVLAASPDLIIAGWGANDINNNTPAQFQTYLTSIISAIRTYLPSKQIPVLVLGKWAPAAAWITPGTFGTWNDLRAARAAYVASDPLSVHLDIANGPLMPQPSSSQATTLSLYSDTVHGNAKSYAMLADIVAGFIAP